MQVCPLPHPCLAPRFLACRLQPCAARLRLPEIVAHIKRLGGAVDRRPCVKSSAMLTSSPTPPTVHPPTASHRLLAPAYVRGWCSQRLF